MKHTTGDWTLEKGHYEGHYLIVCGESNYCHEYFEFELDSMDGEQLEEAVANLRVMAAGFDMLEALELAKVVLEHDVPGSCWSTGPLLGTAEDAICQPCKALRSIDKAIAKAKGEKE